MATRPLTQYFVRKTIESLPLTAAYKKHALKLLELMGDDQRINVAKIHEHLFPISTVASANSSLNRLLAAINDAASKSQQNFRGEITAGKKIGAANRWVWFEGPPPDPEPAYCSELLSIPEDSLVPDQQGYFPSEYPVVVLITFNEHETRAVIDQFHRNSEPERHPITGVVCNRLGIHGGMEIILCVSRQGEDEAQRLTHAIIQGLRPRAIIGVGIAFGTNPEEQQIGDVLLPKDIQGYDLARVSPGCIEPRGPRPDVSDLLYQLFNQTDHTCCAMPDSCSKWPTIHTGTVLSGSKLIDNLDYRQSLETLAPKIIGGEMEGLGIKMAADSNHIDWIIIKAICDWADGNKNSASKEQDQLLAARNAAFVVYKALSGGNLYPGHISGSDAWITKNRGGLKKKTPEFPSMRRQDLEDIHETRRYELFACPISMHKDDTSVDSQENSGSDVLTTLLAWSTRKERPHFFALLGEYGMGKTITCQRLDKELRKRRQADSSQPLSIYFDLRHITGLDKRVPTLTETVRECIERGGIARAGENEYSLENLYTLADLQPLVLIFDGLDEVLVKLKENDGQIFTRELLRFFVDVQTRRSAKNSIPLPKILISCRSQFFRTLRDQQNHFTGQERGEHRADAFNAMVLLPLSEEQILHYLGGVMPGSDPQRLLETIRAVHNLTELSQRPYTLKLVADYLPSIEEDRMRGAPVYGVTLYRRMAKRWLERDAGKHHIRPEHKMRLAAHLAAYLWQNGSGLLPAGDIERWFHEWLENEPDMRRRYSRIHPDQLEEDLRTATFLAREDAAAGSAFRFAHSSLLEFFLADYLLQAVKDDKPQCWQLHSPSKETLTFLGQMFAESGEKSLLATLHRWGKNYLAKTTELLVMYCLEANRLDLPCPSMTQWDLRSARLSNMQFIGSADRLDLSGCNFSDAELRNCRMENVRLDGCQFIGSKLFRAEFLNCTANQASFAKADLTGAVFRNFDEKYGGIWRECDFRAKNCHRCRWLSPGKRPSEIYPDCFFPEDAPAGTCFPPTHPTLSKATIIALNGHDGSVISLALSHDSSRLYSGGCDGLKIWDSDTGECLNTLKGHKDWVVSLTLSADDLRLYSGSFDGSIKSWDAATGECLNTLKGHKDWVNCLALSTDGARLYSGGSDGVKIWDTATGECLYTLKGHEDSVNSLVLTTDGARLYSGGCDGLKIWDTATGECLYTLKGHEDSVNSLVLTTDGARLYSGGNDGTLKIWDAATGECLNTLKGHESSVNSLALTTDGLWLYSGGTDGARIWDTATGECLNTLKGHEYWVDCLALSTDGARLYFGGSGGLKIWDKPTGDCLNTLKGHGSSVNSLVLTTDGARLYSGGSDGVKIWDTATGECLNTLKVHEGSVSSLSLTTDGLRLYSGGSDGVKIWDTATGECLNTLKGHKDWVNCLALSTDGARLYSGGSDGVKIWDTATGECLNTLKGHGSSVNSLVLTTDGTRLYSGGSDDGSLKIWNATTGECLNTLRGHGDWASCLALSPDGLWLYWGGIDGVKIWDTATGECLDILKEHKNSVSSIAISPDGLRLYSGSIDGRIMIWDTATFSLLMPVIHTGQNDWAVVDYNENKVVQCGPEAWRRLAWQGKDEKGWITTYPVEITGPLPIAKL